MNEKIYVIGKDISFFVPEKLSTEELNSPDPKFPLKSNSTAKSFFLLDLNMFNQVKKIFFVNNESNLIKKNYNYNHKILNCLILCINHSLLNNNLSYVIDKLIYGFIELHQNIYSFSYSSIQKEKALFFLFDAHQELLDIKEQHLLDLNVNKSIYKNYIKLVNMFDCLNELMKDFFIIHLNENEEIIEKNYIASNLSILFDSYVINFNYKIETIGSATEHLLNANDKSNYPKCLLEEENIDKIFNQDNTEHIDIFMLNLFLSKRNKNISLELSNENLSVGLYQIYCLINFITIIKFFVEKNTFNYEKNTLEEKSFEYLSKLKIRSFATTSIIDLVATNIVNKYGLKKTGKLEGFLNYNILFENKDKDKKFKNTVFDISDMLFCLHVINRNYNNFYVSKDRAVLIFKNVYKINKSRKKIKNILSEKDKINSMDINLEKILSDMLKKGPPLVYRKSGIDRDFCKKLISSKDFPGFISIVLKKYCQLISIEKEIYLFPFINDVSSYYEDKDYIFIKKNLIDITYNKKSIHYFSSKDNGSFVDNKISQICAHYVSWLIGFLGREMEKERNVLLSLI